MPQALQVVIIKPSKYLADGFVERFRRGFMPNSTVPYMCSMVPVEVAGVPVETQTVDEYVHTDLEYLKLLSRPEGKSHARGPRGGSKPPVPSRTGPRRLRPKQRLHDGHRRAARHDLRHLDAAWCAE